MTPNNDNDEPWDNKWEIGALMGSAILIGFMVVWALLGPARPSQPAPILHKREPKNRPTGGRARISRDWGKPDAGERRGPW